LARIFDSLNFVGVAYLFFAKIAMTTFVHIGPSLQAKSSNWMLGALTIGNLIDNLTNTTSLNSLALQMLVAYKC